MKFRVFTVYDVKANAYLPPFVLPETGMAVRTFADAINDKDHAFGKHPGDYTLFDIGLFNDATGLLDGESPKSVHNGIELVARSGDEDQGELPLKVVDNG